MELELKHLAGYLPYKLPIKIRQEEQISRDEWKEFEYDNFLNGSFLTRNLKDITPILRPLSDFIKEIEHNGERFVPIRRFYDMRHVSDSELDLWLNEIVKDIENDKPFKFSEFEKLYEWHFDIKRLIQKGLAISIHDVVQAVP